MKIVPEQGQKNTVMTFCRLGPRTVSWQNSGLSFRLAAEHFDADVFPRGDNTVLGFSACATRSAPVFHLPADFELVEQTCAPIIRGRRFDFVPFDRKANRSSRRAAWELNSDCIAIDNNAFDLYLVEFQARPACGCFHC